MLFFRVDGTIRWLDQQGTWEWAVGEVKRRLGTQVHANGDSR